MNYMTFIIPAVVVALLALPLLKGMKGTLTPQQAKRRIIANICVFALVCVAGVATPIGSLIVNASAEPAAAAAATAAVSFPGSWAQAFGFISAALVTSIAAIASAKAIAAAAPAAIGAVSEDPKSFGKVIIVVVLGEGIAIYGLLISILIINKL